MLKALFIIAAVLAVILAATLLIGAYRWNNATQRIRARLYGACVPVTPPTVNFQELEHLPEPVQRYFRLVLKEGQPMVTAVHVQHHGRFDISGNTGKWKPFISDQLVVMKRPGFDWNASLKVGPGIRVRVHDAYIAGEGILCASLLGLISMADINGTGDIAEGELMRFLAEAAWYPTALLPSQGISWESLDDVSAKATLTDGALSVTLSFTFDSRGLIEKIEAQARGRMVGTMVIPTSWQCRVWNYERRVGMFVPLDGEVAWFLPEGAAPYWRGRITQIEYFFVR